MDDFPTPTAEAIAALAPTGTLRAAINLSNFLLVSRQEADGTPVGVSPDMAIALADTLGVPVELSTYPSPGSVSDAAVEGVWDIGNIGAEPKRAENIAFTNAYAEIEATYLVPAGAPHSTLADVDAAGVTISVKARAAYCLWLERNLEHAELRQYPSHEEAIAALHAGEVDVAAGLRPKLTDDTNELEGSRVLDGRFTAVQQAIGTPLTRAPEGAAYLETFVQHALRSGFVAERIAHHNANGLSAASPTD